MIIGLDVGGTHTDVVLLDQEGLVDEVKVYTDPDDLFNSVLAGLEKITRNVNPKKIRRLVLSTTLTTNAIAQGKLPPVGMVVSSGPGINPEFFRTNEHYHVVSGSIDHRGRRIEPVDQEEIAEVGKKLEAEGVQHVGIVGKFSARNPSHELEIRRILRNYFESTFLGHRISGNLNFPRRIATTFLNAAVYPVHKKFFTAVRRSLEQQGLKIPIHILKADGGTMSLESSIEFPGQTILSGPAASIMGATAFAPADEDVIVLDIGGTTTDMSILVNGVPLLDPFGIELGGYKTLIRSLKNRSIGIGGDSLVCVQDGQLTIGPERHGFAMGYGGSKPTPTDALIVLGQIQDADKEKASSGLAPIAGELGLSVEEAASLIFEQATQAILTEIAAMIDEVNSKPVYTVHELREGYQVKPKTIMVLGGPAPYFAEQLSRMSDFSAMTVPRWKVANAIGAAFARTTCEVTLFADTSRGIITAPEEKFKRDIQRDFTKEQAIEKAIDLLKQKAIEKGADADDFVPEVLEDLQFNMVRGFNTIGRNIRIKVQIKPGLVRRFEDITQKLASQEVDNTSQA